MCSHLQGGGNGGGDGGGGSFFLACYDLGKMFDHLFPACTFFKVDISMRTLISLFMPGSVHSGSAS